MKFNPQMLVQMLIQRNPNAMAQLQRFQQMMNGNPQMKQQFDTFKNNIASNPGLQQQAMQEAMAKINSTPSVNTPGAVNNTKIG